uniref:Putative secreted protein n=1 Tax=Anopheles triannulatus TaxID=58253 RepID=A0A2M4B7J5_9DIPT
MQCVTELLLILTHLPKLINSYSLLISKQTMHTYRSLYITIQRALPRKVVYGTLLRISPLPWKRSCIAWQYAHR